MKNRNRGSVRFALSVLGWVCLATGSAQAADGTIHFVGEIVAAPYELRTAAPAPTTEVIFLRQLVDRPSATVRVDGLGAQPLAVRFTDARERGQVVDAKSGQAIGQDGGTLSIRPAGAPAAGKLAGALVTVSYN